MKCNFFTSSGLKKISLLNIVIQLNMSLSALAIPVYAIASDQRVTGEYVLGKGETAQTVAAKHSITVDELKTLNQLRTFSSGFENITEGSVIDVPMSKSSTNNQKQISEEQNKTVAAAWATKAGSFFQSNPDGDDVANLGRGLATDQASQEIQNWLGKKGTAKVNLSTDENFSLKGSSLDVLYPLSEDSNSIFFTQVGIRDADDRTQANLGFGYRHYVDGYMLGGSLFYDHDLSRDHNRLGIGAEYWRDYLKLGANAYVGLSGWKDSPDLEDYEERAADGWDIRAEGYIPAYPQLGGKLSFEQYYGDKVALFGNSEDDLQKDPYAITAGVIYTPVPLVSVNMDYKSGKDGQNETQLAANLNYSFGVPFREQINSSAVATQKTLLGSRYDLVDRNNNIILEYRKKEVIRLKTIPLVTGKGGEQKSLGVSVTANHGLDRIQWTADTLFARGGKIIHDGGEKYSVSLPKYNDSGENSYVISGVAYDKKGNASSPSETQVSVLQSQISKGKSQFTPSQTYLPADANSVQTLTLSIRDEQGLPISLDIGKLALNIEHGTLTKNSKRTKDTRQEAVVSAFKNISPGNYEVSVTSGTIEENITLIPVADGITLAPAKVTVGGLPVISGVTITGKLELGAALSGQYKFEAGNGEPTDRSLYLWGHQDATAGSVAGSGTAVTTGGTVPAYTLAAADTGEVMELSVQAKNGASVTGNTETVTSAPGDEGNGTDGGDGGGHVIDPAAGPLISSLAISGTLETGKPLNGTYAFDANGGDLTDRSLYLWGHQDATAGSVAGSGTAVTTGGTVPAYTLAAADTGEVMELSVQAKNGASVTGNTETVTSAPGDEGNGTDGGDGGGHVIDPAAGPLISSLAISGTLEAGQDLNGTYAFDANNGEPTDRSLYLWGHQDATAGSVAGSGTAVTTGGTVPAYTLAAADAGEVMELSVQAKNGASVTGNTETVTSAPGDEGNGTDGGDGGGHVINPAAGPLISSLAISGTLETGKPLNGTYAFDANNGEPTDRSLYLWGHQDATAGSVAGSGTAVTTGGTVPAYTLAAADAGEVMELSVQAKNGASVTGNTETVTSAPGDEGNGTDGGDGGGHVIDPAAGPLISSLAISGTLEAGQDLNGTYAFDANNGEPTDRSLYLWGHQDATAGSVAGSGTAVTTGGTVPAYRLKITDIGEMMELSVQAKNGASVTGNTETVTSAPGDEGNGTDGGDGGGHVINPAAGPLISSLAISGTLETGKPLNGTYAFDANNGEPTDRSLYLWGHQDATAGSVAGSGTAVTTGGTVPAYTLAAADAGEVMELSVQAKNGASVTGNTETVTSAPGDEGNGTDGGDGGGHVIDPAAGPLISSLAISGTLEAGQDLNGTYAFDANNGEPTDRSLYLWGHQDATAGSVAGSGTAVTTGGTVPAYRLKITDIGEMMELSVQAKNGASVTGNTETVTSAPGDEGNGTDGGDGGGHVINPAAGPLISSLAISGTLETGKPLNGTYAFDANNGEPTDRSLYLWGHQDATAGSVAGSGTAVTTGGTVPAYTLAAADAGEVMELSVQAKNGASVTGNTETVTSAPGDEGNGTDGGDGGGHVIDPAAGPLISSLAISGTLEAGQDLNGTYAFDANNGEPTDRSLYLWGHQDATAGSVAGSGTAVTTGGTVPAYRLKITDIGEMMELSVQAKNGASVTGNTETVTSAPGDEGNGTDGGDGGGHVINPAAGPLISSLAISGTLEAGQDLNGTYAFDANNGEPTDRSLYLWGHQDATAGSVAGSGTAVTTGGTVPAYTLAAADAGEVMELSVQAKNGASVTGNTETVTSAPGDEGNGTDGGDGGGHVIDPAAGPLISSLAISGTLEAGQDLNGTYAFDANNGEPTDRSLYLWGHQDATAGSVAGSGTAVTTGGTVPAYRLKITDIGEMMELSVQAKNGASVTGNTETVTSAPGDEGNGTDGGDGGGHVINPAAGPLISSLAISGTLETGKPLNGTYAFDANNGEPTDRSLYLWGHQDATAGSVAGSGTAVTTGGTVPAYTLAAADAGEVMELSVQAKNGASVTGNTETVTSAPGDEGNGTDGGDGGGHVIDPAAGPLISSLAISGTLEAGQDLNGTYAFDANNGEPTDRSLYLWGHQDATAGSVAGSGTAVTTGGTVPAYTLAAADAGEVMELSVQAKNGASVTGNTETVTSAPGDEGNGTDGGDGGGHVIDPAAGPLISSLAISGTLEAGQDLNGTYTFDANNGDTRDKSLFQWGYKGETASLVLSSNNVVSTSGMVDPRRLSSGDAGEVMELSVQAKNGVGNIGNLETIDSSMVTGNETEGGLPGGLVIDPNAAPKVENLSMTGTLTVGHELQGSYTFNPNKGDPTDQSLFAWGYKDETSSVVASGTVITESGKVEPYTVKALDAGMVMELSVRAKNSLNMTGNTSTVVAEEEVQQIELDVSVDKNKVKKGETIRLTVLATNDSGVPTEDLPVVISFASAKNRQNVNESITAKVNGQDTFVGNTNSSGEVIVNITDNDTRGLETELTVKVGDVVKSENVIFTVLTSPDSSFANYWGHMEETVTAGGITFTRPLLAEEATNESGTRTVNNETYARYVYSAAMAMCTLASVEELEELGGQIAPADKTVGWPAPTVPNSQGYRSSTVDGNGGHFNVDMDSGIRGINVDTNESFVACKQ